MDINEELKKFRFRNKVAVRWSDMDEMRHVNNAVYLTYFEEGRVHYFNEVCNLDWESEGVILATATVNYHLPLLFTDNAYLYLRVSKMGTKSFEFTYLLVREDANGTNTLLTSGTTTLVMFDYKSNRSVPVPDMLKEQIATYEPQHS